MKFKVGDRIRVYQCEVKDTGTISDISEDGLIKVVCKETTYIVHYKQCRRLIKKKPKQVLWINPSPDLYCEHISPNPKEGWFKFREIKE